MPQISMNRGSSQGHPFNNNLGKACNRAQYSLWQRAILRAIQAYGFDADNTFMLVEIAGDEMYFQAISRAGQVVDSGMIQRQASSNATSSTN
jgi:hypothetical protein